ncbi:GntR family transcriptional regulator [Streptomyces sp. OF3]|uniref:GntR family transcriptional regulator n=1 Tax=Streptomyces alkaliterrae TaxID=2213162 RepID=A0A7W3WP93_9ACTN|nr:GntR family transcriptional regulator [Streptomyces alkaliterrae]MBB1256028.1 GntR family transcriptional regulator [Streptomyces alkaliterrae]
MLITIDTTSAVPLSEQVASSARRAMAEGSLRPGDRLPSARDVARSLGVNMHTVLRGYQTLRSEGLIDLRPGRGAVVTEAAAQSKAALIMKVRELADVASALGMTEDEVVQLVRGALRSPGQPVPHV